MSTNTPHSWSRGGLEEADTCPSCSSNQQATTVYERRDNEQSMPDKWRMQQCAECRSLWLNPRPDADSLPRAYDDYFTHNTGNQGVPSGLVGALVNGYLNQRFSMQRQPAIKLGHTLFSLIEPWRLKLDYYGRHLTPKNVGKPGKLLDIGCGNGEFLERSLEMGWQAQGCEIDPKAVAICRSNGLNVLEGDSFHTTLNEQRFDVITMSHVLEHVVDQAALLQRTYSLLKPGGYLWMALPNPQSLGLRLFNAAWNQLHPPCHLSIPSQAVLLRWLENKGYEEIQLIRRGAHTQRVWQESQAIAKREAIASPAVVHQRLLQNVSTVLATVSSRYSEETVVLARKPKAPYAR